MLYRTLYNRISKKTGIDPKYIRMIMRAYSDLVYDAILDAELVPLPYIGKFKVTTRSYKISNLYGEKKYVPEGKKLTFYANDKFKAYIKNNPFVQLSKLEHKCHFYPSQVKELNRRIPKK